MTQIVPRAVRPEPLPSPAKPWGRAGIHLACLYAAMAVPLVMLANDWDKGMESGRQHVEEIGLAPFIEDAEHNTVADPVTNEVTEIGPLNYDLHLELGRDWLYSGYTNDEKAHICEVFQVDPDQVWANLVQNMGFPDTPENQATMDAAYQEKCSFYNG